MPTPTRWLFLAFDASTPEHILDAALGEIPREHDTIRGDQRTIGWQSTWEEADAIKAAIRGYAANELAAIKAARESAAQKESERRYRHIALLAGAVFGEDEWARNRLR